MSLNEIHLRHRLAQADSYRPSPTLKSVSLGYRITAREIALALHKAALQGHKAVDFGFFADMPYIIRQGYLNKAKSLLQAANLKAPKVVRPVNTRR